MNKKIMKIGTSLYTVMSIILLNANRVFAEVTFNGSQAQADIKALLDPVANFLLMIAVPVTAVAIGISYVGWNGKDEQEKENMPFYKVVMKHIIAFVIFGLSGAILKWFSIS